MMERMRSPEGAQVTVRLARAARVRTAALALAIGVAAPGAMPAGNAATRNEVGVEGATPAGTAAPATSPPHEARAVAAGHGVAHDARAVRSIERWLALGSPTGRASSSDDEDVDRVVTLRTTGSELAFEPARLSLESGTRVRIEYVNEGTLPHNFVLLRSEADLDALGAGAYEAEATGYVPVDRQDAIIAYTQLAPPGATVSVTFEVPAPGTYTFVCLFPGHYNVMLGTLRALKPTRP